MKEATMICPVCGWYLLYCRCGVDDFRGGDNGKTVEGRKLHEMQETAAQGAEDADNV
jgi:hypothetical protein